MKGSSRSGTTNLGLERRMRVAQIVRNMAVAPKEGQDADVALQLIWGTPVAEPSTIRA